MARLSKAQVKLKADRAEARSRGEAAAVIDDDEAEWECGFDEAYDKAKRERSREIIEAEIKRLALLPDLEYQIERKPAAKRLEISLSALDGLVKAKRPKDGSVDSFALPHWDVESWPSAIVGADVLDGLKAVFQKYIFAPPAVVDAAALWVLHAWTIDAGDISPFFVLVSPTKRCGKNQYAHRPDVSNATL